MPQTQKKPPVRREDLPRQAGQSLDNKIDDIRGGLIQGIVPGVFIAIWLLYEWVRWFFEIKVNMLSLIAPTVMIAFYSAYVAVKARELKKKLDQCKQGRDGEVFVGGHLEKLRACGARVTHDILCGGFNIDHVVILNSGIYVIETKAYSMPEVGGEIIFDGKMISIRGVKTEKPIKQARNAARWLHDLLEKEVPPDKKFFIIPVVIFPRWRVTDKVSDEKYVLVMSEKQFCDKITAEQKAPYFTEEEVKRFCARIANYQKEYYSKE